MEGRRKEEIVLRTAGSLTIVRSKHLRTFFCISEKKRSQNVIKCKKTKPLLHIQQGNQSQQQSLPTLGEDIKEPCLVLML